MTDREVLESILAKIGDMDSRISSMDSRISSMDSRISSMDSKISSMDSKILSMDSKILSMDSKISSMDSKISSMDSRITGIESNMATKQELAEVKSDLKFNQKIILKIENEHGQKLSALFDGYKQNSEKLDRIEAEVSRHEEFILRRVK